MEFSDLIRKRRSIRKYINQEIPNNTIDHIINDARQAPSGNNKQPWKYKVIKDKKTKEKLKKANIFKQNFVYKAPVIIVCCTDSNVYPRSKHEPGFDDTYKGRAGRDLTIATAYLELKAVELGLGTCWVGWTNKEKIKEVLNIPKKYYVPYVLTMGYAAEDPKPRGRKPLEEMFL